MIKPLRVWMGGREVGPPELEAELSRLRSAGARLEVEIGFGKGRYLLDRAAAEPDVTFIGVESATLYWAETTRRAERRSLANVITICGDALYLLAVCLERESASAVHVYFPDPWPKTRHHRRRLLDPSTVDLVFGLLAPGAKLWFATDHAEYGAAVLDVLARYPAAAVERVEGPWPDGERTHYETKYEAEGRPILRLLVTRRAPAGASLLHPDGADAIAAGSIERAGSHGRSDDGPVE
jgi:tRNA (guanine-N7-)-methyltransferase